MTIDPYCVPQCSRGGARTESNHISQHSATPNRMAGQIRGLPSFSCADATNVGLVEAHSTISTRPSQGRACVAAYRLRHGNRDASAVRVERKIETSFADEFEELPDELRFLFPVIGIRQSGKFEDVRPSSVAPAADSSAVARAAASASDTHSSISDYQGSRK